MDDDHSALQRELRSHALFLEIVEEAQKRCQHYGDHFWFTDPKNDIDNDDDGINYDRHSYGGFTSRLRSFLDGMSLFPSDKLGGDSVAACTPAFREYALKLLDGDSPQTVCRRPVTKQIDVVQRVGKRCSSE